MQTQREPAIATYQAPADHPDSAAHRLATDVILRALKALNENDRAEIEESARFFSNTRKDGLLYFWLYMQSAKDPEGSHRMAVCKKIGDKVVYHIGQTRHIIGTTKFENHKAAWTRTFHEVKDIPELAVLTA